MIFAVNNCCSLALGGGDYLVLGESLVGNQSIISKNGMFELGFFSPRGTNNWYIGIWYAQIYPQVIVWVANRDNPIRSMLGVLKFSSDGHLRLLDGPNNSEIVWESFAHSTDTWLPGMKLWKGMKLTSWKSYVDPTSGLFSVGMDMSPGKTTDADGCISVDEKGEIKYWDLMDDGTWNQGWSTYQGQCSGYDIYGANGLCNIANDVCSCIKGFKPKRDTKGWWSSGCSRRRLLQCSVIESTTDGFLESKNQNLPEEESISYKKKSTMQIWGFQVRGKRESARRKDILALPPNSIDAGKI
ncbi:S-locus-specific glycoprotein S6-like [Cryptomeria japonica]|uniref:S-locus-specific glycoprotein S6-like n=1 Tax=Cryptomeria japonica TaxID=3369 RepID=UPI0025ABBB7F|nr:S-locus-specific glycoprotein S6-like [Cryptomeria japonica]